MKRKENKLMQWHYWNKQKFTNLLWESIESSLFIFLFFINYLTEYLI